MEWYGPITVLPAVALLILSTSNLVSSLNVELFQLEQMEKLNTEIIKMKLEQLRKLGIAMALLYVSTLLFLLAGISKAIFLTDAFLEPLMLIGVLSIAFALGFLLIHSLKAVSIRQKHLDV